MIDLDSTLDDFVVVVIEASNEPDRYVEGTADTTTLRHLGLVDAVTAVEFIRNVQEGVKPMSIEEQDVPVALDTTVQDAATQVMLNVF